MDPLGSELTKKERLSMRRSFFCHTHRNFCRESSDLLSCFCLTAWKDKSKKSKLIHFDHLNHEKKGLALLISTQKTLYERNDLLLVVTNQKTIGWFLLEEFFVA